MDKLLPTLLPTSTLAHTTSVFGKDKRSSMEYRPTFKMNPFVGPPGGGTEVTFDLDDSVLPVAEGT